MRPLIMVCVVLLAGGCAAVYSPAPVGERPANIESDVDAWEGSWLHPEGGVLTVKVVDGPKGILHVGGFGDEEGALKPEIMELFLREGGGWTFASMQAPGETNDNRYIWGRIKREERAVLFWGPDVDQFRRLVEEGALPGTVDGRNIVLGNLASEHVALITSGTNGVLFRWDAPLVLMKWGP